MNETERAIYKIVDSYIDVFSKKNSKTTFSYRNKVIKVVILDFLTTMEREYMSKGFLSRETIETTRDDLFHHVLLESKGEIEHFLSLKFEAINTSYDWDKETLIRMITLK